MAKTKERMSPIGGGKIKTGQKIKDPTTYLQEVEGKRKKAMEKDIGAMLKGKKMKKKK